MNTYEWLATEAARTDPALLEHPSFRKLMATAQQATHSNAASSSHENRYRSILEKSSDIIYTTDINGFFTFVNKVAEEITGYTSAELLSIRYLDLVAENFLPRAKKFYQVQVARKIPSTYFEFPINSRSKGVRWIGQSVQLSTNAKGEHELIALAIDITRKKEEEQRLKETNRRLQLFQELMDGSTEAIVVLAEDGSIFYMNNEAGAHYNVAPANMSGRTIADLDPAFHSPAAWSNHVQELLQNTVLTYESTHLSAGGGSGVPVEVREKYIRIGDSAYIVVNSRDISAQRAARTYLQSQEEKYRNIITNMRLGLLEVDRDGHIQFANQSFLTMSGYEASEVAGQDAARLFAIDSDVDKVLSKGEMRRRGASDMYEVQVYTKSREKRWWMVSGAPNYNDKGEMIGSVGIHLDITDQKRLSAELQAAIRHAEDASRAKEAFLANMSHEIRTPLNGIIGMIRDLQHEQLSPRQHKYVENAFIASRHLLSVLNDVLDMSKIEAKELMLEQRPFSLATALRDVKRMINSSARGKGLFLWVSSLDVEDVNYMGDGFRIKQILLNVIGNAIKFTEQGGVFVDCSVSPQSDGAHAVTITVEDTGIGMEQDFQEALFRKFSQEDASTSRRYGGSGLGMAISSQLLQLMGGRISVNSQKGVGTVVSIVLILPPADAGITADTTRQRESDLRGMRVLLAEDNEFNLAVAVRSLQRFGCVVTTAQNGREAVDLIRSGNHFDAVLMDMQMPVLDGIAATRIIREELKNVVPVIALTANAFKAEIEVCRQVGMNDYITKPYDENVMREVLASFWSSAAATDLPGEESPEELLYDLATLNQISGGDEAFVREMITLFCQQAVRAAAEMQEAFTTKELQVLAATAHRIKASIDNMGIVTLKQPIRDLERTAKSGSGSATELRSVLEIVVSGLDKVTRQLSALEAK